MGNAQTNTECNLEKKIQRDIMSAMAIKDHEWLSAVRSIKAEITNAKTAGSNHTLTDADVLNLIKKLVKQRQEASEIYGQAYDKVAAQAEQTEQTEAEKAKLKKLKESEDAQMAKLKEYLPAELSEAEITEKSVEIIQRIGATSIRDMGKVMQIARAEFGAAADSSTLSRIVKSLLTP